MVASHGGSPSGRLTAVFGRSSSPLRVPGRCDVLAVGDNVPFLTGPDGFRSEVGVAFLDEPATGGVFSFLVGDPGLLPEPEPIFGVGVLAVSAASWLALLSLLLVLLTEIPSSGLMLLLIVLFRGRGVSLSSRSAGIGCGLLVITGIREPDFRNVGCE